jgi:hypothetical protein
MNRSINARLAKLERRKEIEAPVCTNYTAEQYQNSMAALAEVLGDRLGVAPVNVAAALPAALAGINEVKK